MRSAYFLVWAVVVAVVSWAAISLVQASFNPVCVILMPPLNQCLGGAEVESAPQNYATDNTEKSLPNQEEKRLI